MFRRGLAAILVLGAGGAGASAADLDTAPPPEPANISLSPRWEGFTFGAYASGNWSGGQSVSQSWYAPYPSFSSTAPTSFSLGSVGGGVGVQVGYDKQYGQFVYGVMADYGVLADNKTTTGYSGTITWPGVHWHDQPFNGDYSQQLQGLGTARWRLGWAPNNDWLVYGSAGLAIGQTTTSSNLQMANSSYSFNGSRTGAAVGYTIGAGFQYAMGPSWSLGLDGLYYDLGSRDGVATANFITYALPSGAIVPSPQLSYHSDFSGFQLRLTALYQFDGETADAGVFPSSDPNTDVPIAVGIRAGYSTGKTQMTLYNGSGGAQVSRLTYNNADTFTAEPYFNLDIPNWGLYLTGFVGFGQQRNGNLQDEDFPPYISPYSSTNSPLQDGQLEYGVLDVGYNFWQADFYKIGGFLGYTFENDSYNAYDCTQTASNPDVCAGGPAVSGINSNTLTISDQYTWNAARIGISGAVNAARRILRSAATWPGCPM